MKKSPILNASYLFGGRGLAILCNFLATVHLAKRVGVINFGWLSFSLSLTSYALILTDFGLLTLGVRRLTQEPEDKEIVSNLLSLRLFLSLIVFFLLLALTLLLSKPPTVKRLIFLYSFFLFLNSLSLDWFFQAKEEMFYIGLNRLFSSFSYLFFLYLFVKAANDYLNVPKLFLVSQGIGLLFLFFLYRRTGATFNLRFDAKKFSRLFLSALPLGLTNLLQILYTYFGIIFLGFFGQPKELGIYSAMHRLLYSTLIIDLITSYLFLPLISSFYSQGWEKLPKLFSLLTRLLLSLTLPISLLVSLFSQPLISFLFGQNYLEGAPLLCLLIFFLPLTTLSTIYATGLIAGKREKVLLFNTLIGTIINLTLSATLYFQWKTIGLVLGFLFGEVFIVTKNFLSLQKEMTLPLKGFIPKIDREVIRFLLSREL